MSFLRLGWNISGTCSRFTEYMTHVQIHKAHIYTFIQQSYLYTRVSVVISRFGCVVVNLRFSLARGHKVMILLMSQAHLILLYAFRPIRCSCCTREDGGNSSFLSPRSEKDGRMDGAGKGSLRPHKAPSEEKMSNALCSSRPRWAVFSSDGPSVIHWYVL